MWRKAFPRVRESFLHLLERGELESYADSISNEGIAWWFNMDTPTILIHLVPFQSTEPMKLPKRVQFLIDATRPVISHEKMDYYFRKFLEQGDIEAAASASGAGVASVWDSGHDMERYEIWRERIRELLERTDSLSPLAVASLKGFIALMELTGGESIEHAYRAYLNQRIWAEKAKSTPLLIYFSAASAYCLTWMGRFSEAEILVKEARPLCEMPESNLAVNVYFKIMEGHFRYLKGETEKAEEILREITSLPYFENLPIPACLMALGHLLLCVARRGDEDEVEKVADTLRRWTIPERNYFHHAYSLYSLGTAYLMINRPRLALACGKEAEERARLSGSRFISQIPPLIIGQALSDLGMYDEAEEVFGEWLERWIESGFMLLASSCALELAGLHLKKRGIERAREFVEKARELVPKGELEVCLNRSQSFARNIRAALSDVELDGHVEILKNRDEYPVQIKTFGELRIKIGDRMVHDKDWKGGKTKLLLKALIVFGGARVPYSLLQDILWPDSDGDVAENNLKVVISRLRRIGDNPERGGINWIMVKNKKVSLSRAFCFVDSLIFGEVIDRAFRGRPNISLVKEALDLYEDDFLPKDDSDAWIIRHREKLKDKFVSGVFLFSNAVKNIGETDVAIPYLLKAIEKDSVNEELYAYLMELYLELGFPARAARIYRRAETELKRELGVEPGKVLRDLARRAGISSK